MTKTEHTRTLVMMPNWVGDTVMALPVLDVLAASGRQVVTMSRPNLQPLLRTAGAVAKAETRAAVDGDTIAAIKRLEADEAVILPNSFRSAWLPYRAGVPEVWGYRGNFRRWLLSRGYRQPPTRGRHQIADYDELLSGMGLPTPAREPRLTPAAIQRDSAQRVLVKHELGSDHRPIVGVFPGAEFGPSKRWPAARFADLVRALAALSPQPRLAVVAGPREMALGREVATGASPRLPILGPDLDLAVLAAVLERFDLLVTNDSGPMHLAAAVGTSCVSLFGPTDPSRTAPLGTGHKVLSTGRWCSPCFRRRCPLLHHKCLRDITVEQVTAACRRRLEAVGPQSSS